MGFRINFIRVSMLTLLFLPTIVLFYWGIYDVMKFTRTVVAIIEQWLMFSFTISMLNVLKLK